MAHIWKRMLAIYGHKWASHLGEAANDDGTLSDSAKTWQKGLVGMTLDNLKNGFDALVMHNLEWPPSLPEFRKLCSSKQACNAPSLDEVINTLVMASSRQGSISTRYRHPLSLAISRHDGVDMFAIRTAKTVDVRRMIKAAYDDCLKSGWNDWTEDELKEPDVKQKALGYSKPRNKEVGVSAFNAIKAAL
jgi:hypothetical protein